MPKITNFHKKLPWLPLLVILLFSFQGYGQQQKNFDYYDSLTFNLYSQQKWEMLATAGKEALSKGYDYQYLRLRLGLAYYAMNDFRAAAPQFEKSLSFNSDDSATLQLLYYTYLESGRNNEALSIAKNYNGKLNTLPGASSKTVSAVYTEGGYTTGVSTPISPSELMGSDSIYGEEDFYSSQLYYHFGIQIQPYAKLSVYVSGSLLDIQKQKHFSYTTYDQQTFVREYTDTILPYNFLQKEFYIAAAYIPVTGLNITPAFHYMNGAPDVISCTYTDTNYVINHKNYPYANYVFSLAATKELGRFSLGLHGSYAQLTATGNQVQSGVSVTWYPLGNLNLYTSTNITWFKSGNDKRILFDQLIGGKIAPRCWFEGNVTTGNLSLYNEKNAFIVYNLPETINLRGSTNLIFTINKYIDMSLMYRFYIRKYEYYNYSKNQENGELTLTTNAMSYTNQSFFGGLKWKF